MNIKTLVIASAIGAFTFKSTFTNAQKLVYKTASVNMKFGPTLEIDKNILKTYDCKVVSKSSLLESDNSKSIRSKIESNKYNIDFIGLQQTDRNDKNADFHIVVFMDGYTAKDGYSKSGGTMSAEVSLTSFITTADGRELYNNKLQKSIAKATYGKDVELDEVTRLVFENAINTSLAGFQNKLNGYTGEMGESIAFIDADSKKFPQYQPTEDQMKTLLPILRRGDIPGFCAVAEGYMPEWQKYAATTSGDMAEEIQRMGYQNMGLYYILSGNLDKAKEILELYKPIDKSVGVPLFGSIKTTESKYKNSDELEKLIGNITPTPEKLSVVAADKKLSIDDIITNMVFEKVIGTITIDDKKKSGTYTGTILFPKTSPNAGNGNIYSLDTPDPDVIIRTAEGQEIKSNLSNVTSLKGSDGKNYIAMKVSGSFSDKTALSIASKSYVLLKEEYTSPKVSLFRTLIPVEERSSSSILIRKAGDEKGLKTSLFNFKKNLSEYLQDCPKAVEMISNTKSIYKDIQNILETYSSCS